MEKAMQVMQGEATRESAAWQLRATAAEFLAFSLRYPSPELAGALASGEWASAARELAAACGWEFPSGFAEDVACDENGLGVSDSDVLLHVLRTEATRLFAGLPTPVVTPYEGVWRAKEEGASPLLFISRHSVEVERFMRACGIERSEGWKMPIDHVAAELELMELLAASAAGMEQTRQIFDEAALPGGSAAAAYGLFAREHAGVWLPDFARELQEESVLPFYRAAGQLLASWCA